MARQAEFSHERLENGRRESDMTNQVQARGAARFIVQSRSKLLVGLRVVPVVVVRKTGRVVRRTKASGSARSASLVVVGMRAMSS